MGAEAEAELFGIILNAIGDGELINEGIEITLSADGEFELVRYALPNPT